MSKNLEEWKDWAMKLFEEKEFPTQKTASGKVSEAALFLSV